MTSRARLATIGTQEREPQILRFARA